jgi:hypothetical protein
VRFVKLDARGFPIGKRSQNGPEDRGISEASVCLRLPRELHVAMVERARVDGVKVSEAWRRAALAYLQR